MPYSHAHSRAPLGTSKQIGTYLKCFLQNGTNPDLIFVYLLNNPIIQQINVKNVHPVSWTGIQTHNHLFMSHLP